MAAEQSNKTIEEVLAKQKASSGLTIEQVMAKRAATPSGPFPATDTRPMGTKTYGPEPAYWVQQQHMKDFAKRAALEGGKALLTTGTGMLGGVAAKAIGAGEVLIPSLAEAFGQFAGELGRQKIQKEPVNLKRAGIEAGFAGGGRLLTSGGASLAGHAAGVPRESVKAALVSPRLTAPIPRETYADLADEIRYSYDNLPTSFGRKKFEGLLTAKDASGQLLDGQRLVDNMGQAMSKETGPGVGTATSMMRRHMKRVSDRVLQVSHQTQTGMISASDFDKILREEFTQPIHNIEQRAGGKQFRSALENARNKSADYLYNEVGGGAAGYQSSSAESMSALEGMQAIVKPRTGPNIPDPASISRLKRALFTDEGVELERAVNAYDKQWGTRFGDRLKDLKVRADWNPQDIKDMEEIGQMFVVSTKPRSLVKAGVRGISKGLLKAQQYGGPLRSLVASHAQSIFEDAMSQKKESPK